MIEQTQFILLLGVYYNTIYIKSIEFKNEPIYEYTCTEYNLNWNKEYCIKHRKIVNTEDVVYVNIFQDKITLLIIYYVLVPRNIQIYIN